MLQAVLKVLLFVLANAAAYLAILVIPNLASLLNLYPHFPEGPMRTSFHHWQYGAVVIVFGLCLLASISYFFAENRAARIWILLFPVTACSAFCAGNLAVFDWLLKKG